MSYDEPELRIWEDGNTGIEYADLGDAERIRDERDRLREALRVQQEDWKVAANWQAEADRLRERQARARGLAEAIRDLNEKSYSLTGLREVAEEIVELLTDPTDKEQPPFQPSDPTKDVRW